MAQPDQNHPKKSDPTPVAGTINAATAGIIALTIGLFFTNKKGGEFLEKCPWVLWGVLFAEIFVLGSACYSFLGGRRNITTVKKEPVYQENPTVQVHSEPKATEETAPPKEEEKQALIPRPDSALQLATTETSPESWWSFLGENFQKTIKPMPAITAIVLQTFKDIEVGNILFPISLSLTATASMYSYAMKWADGEINPKTTKPYTFLDVLKEAGIDPKLGLSIIGAVVSSLALNGIEPYPLFIAGSAAYALASAYGLYKNVPGAAREIRDRASAIVEYTGSVLTRASKKPEEPTIQAIDEPTATEASTV